MTIKPVKYRDITLSLILLFILAIFISLQTTYIPVLIMIPLVVFDILLVKMGKDLYAYLINVIFATYLGLFIYFSNNSKFIETNPSCIGPCIGSNLPLLSARIFSIVVIIIILSLLLRRLVEKK